MRPIALTAGRRLNQVQSFVPTAEKPLLWLQLKKQQHQQQGGEGGGIVKDVGGGRVEGIAEKRASAAWYLLPIFLWFIGGLIMFFVLKDEDRGRAKGGLKLGIILSVIGFVLWMLILAAIAATAPATSSFYYP